MREGKDLNCRQGDLEVFSYIFPSCWTRKSMRLPKEVDVKKTVRRTSVSNVFVQFTPCPTAGLTTTTPSSSLYPLLPRVHINGGHTASKGALKLDCYFHLLFLRACMFSIASLPNFHIHLALQFQANSTSHKTALKKEAS